MMDTELSMLPDPQLVKERIDANLQSLKHLASAKRSRSEILTELSKDLSDYYGYLPELTDLLLNLFSPAECREYMEASDHPRPLVIRTNTLKTTRKDLMEALTKRGAAVEAIEWSKVAIKVTESSVPIGATPEYLAGHYMLQSASSLNPVMALAPVPGEKVLDMSAAPGGKTTYISQLMKNSGIVVANDLKAVRQKATIANLHRLGVKNTIVCCYDGKEIPTVFKGFDRVLLDAPCSGLGIIARDQSVKLQRTVKDIQRVAHLQKELLRAAVDTVDANSSTGGVIVYSTCSISVEENEQVIQYILEKRYVKVIETGLEVSKPGLTRYMSHRFHPSVALTRRFYPHVHNMDGFYVAKLKKYRNGPRGEDDDEAVQGHQHFSDDEEEEEEQSVTTEEEEEEVPPKKSNPKQSKQIETERHTKTSVPSKTETSTQKVKNSAKKEPEAPIVTEEKEVITTDEKKKGKKRGAETIDKAEAQEPKNSNSVGNDEKKVSKKAKASKPVVEEVAEEEERIVEEGEADQEEMSEEQKELFKQEIMKQLLRKATPKKRKPLRSLRK